MTGFSCAAAGATSCGWSPRPGTDDEVLDQVVAHLTEVHDVQHVTRTLAKYALAVAHDEVALRADDEPSPAPGR